MQHNFKESIQIIILKAVVFWILKIYLEKNKLTVEILGRGFAWLDTGTFESLLQAANFVQSMEINTGMKIASIEEVACRMGYISKEKLAEISKKYKQNGYGKYLENMIFIIKH